MLALAAALLLGAAAAQEEGGQEKVTASAADANLAVKAMSVEVGGEFKVTSFRLEGDPRGSELELERFEVGVCCWRWCAWTCEGGGQRRRQAW